jgi:hypothetical protein
MFDFLVVQVMIAAVDGYCAGLLLSYLIPVDPARLPRVVAWLQATKDPKPGSSSIPLVPYRLAVSLMAVAILAYTQYIMVNNLVFSPTWASTYGSGRLIGFAGVELPLVAWIAYVFWAFRRGANRD